MSRAFYSEFVNHCLRFYARHPKPSFHSAADKSNWFACDSALKGFTDSEREMLLYIYREETPFPTMCTRSQRRRVCVRTACGSW